MTSPTLIKHPALDCETARAYETWRKSRKNSFAEVLPTLPESQKLALVITTMHQEVYDAGWEQYFENGYGAALDVLNEFMQDINSPAAKQVLDIIRELQDMIAEYPMSHNIDLSDLEFAHYDLMRIGMLDGLYCKCADALLKHADKYLGKLADKE